MHERWSLPAEDGEREAYRQGSCRTRNRRYEQFHRAPAVGANVAVRKLAVPVRLGIGIMRCSGFEGIGNSF